MKVSVYGSTGFVGSNYKTYSKNIVESVDRDNPQPSNTEIIYLIGTTDNYNVLENVRSTNPILCQYYQLKKLESF